MTITYTNRSLQTYYLHQGTTKTGKPKYFFSKKSEGNLVEQIPDGFEIYENPNAQVFFAEDSKEDYYRCRSASRQAGHGGLF